MKQCNTCMNKETEAIEHRGRAVEIEVCYLGLPQFPNATDCEDYVPEDWNESNEEVA